MSRTKRALRGGTAAVVAAAVALTACTTDSQARPPTFRPGARTAGDHWFPGYGNRGYDARHYDIRMSYDQPRHAIDATTRMTATATQNLSQFSLDLDGLHVSDVEVDGRLAKHSRTGHKLVVTPDRGLRRGTRFVVAVDYAGSPEPHGSGPTRTGFLRTNDGAFTVTNDVASDTWFPNNDHPSDKATYRMDVTVAKGLTAVANGRLTRHRTTARTSRFTWRENHPMASYLATVNIGHWTIERGPTPRGVPYFVAVDPQLSKQKDAPKDPARFFTSTTSKVVDEWTEKFGPYPFDSTGAIADYTNIGGKPAGFSEESQTRPVYGSVLSPELIAHELSHQWFGDSVSITDFDDLWLNEGFATWAAWYWDGEHGGTPVEQTVRTQYKAFPASSEYWTHPVSPAVHDLGNQANGARVYYGGAMALQFLREKVGDPTFFTILRTWVAEHRGGNATTAQFVRTAERVSGRDLAGFFRTWVTGTGKPALP